MKAQRDIFIDSIFQAAKNDKNIVFISVDMGAPALDQFREELPNQFIAAGISEQNAINIAAGMSAMGKKVYVYMMACWVARCFEQIRYSCAMGKNPITIIGNGVGLGYAPAGPAHEPTEDLCYMRAIDGLEIYSPSTIEQVLHIARLSLDSPALRYVRLERNINEDVYNRSGSTEEEITDLIKNENIKSPKVIFISSGYMLRRCIDAHQKLSEQGIESRIVDVWKLKPLNSSLLAEQLKGIKLVVTLEEQYLEGAFGAAILEGLANEQVSVNLLRLGFKNAYIFENGNRDGLIDANGLSVNQIVDNVKNRFSALGLENL